MYCHLRFNQIIPCGLPLGFLVPLLNIRGDASRMTEEGRNNENSFFQLFAEKKLAKAPSASQL